jgi:hypothetical protein
MYQESVDYQDLRTTRAAYHRDPCTTRNRVLLIHFALESAMQTTLRDHITLLQDRIQQWSNELTDPHCDLKQREQIAAQIQRAELAVNYYRKAYELENEATS